MALEGKSFLKGYGIWRKKRGNTRKGSSQATPTRPSQFSTAGPSQLESHTKSSRPSSLYPYGDFRNNHPDAINDIKCEVMVNWLHSKQEERIWTTGEPGEGVVLKRSKGRYVCCPYDLQYDCSNFFKMITKLNIRVAITVNTRVIRLILARSDLPYVELTEGLRLQVIPDITALPNCQKHQSAAFVAKQQILIVWEDNPQKLLDRAAYIQDTLMKMIWGTPLMLSVDDEKNTGSVEVTEEGISGTDCHDIEGGEEDAPRRIILINPLICGATLMLVFAAIGGGWRNVAIEIFVDHGYIRLLFILCTIPQIWLALFFFQALMGNVAQLIGPVGQVTENTKFFSGISPKRLHRERRAGLPHVTIQMPVYKEGLHTVIEPTIRSIKTAISTYELQGGTANVFINDDGMQLLPHELARERQDFYDENNIGWVARPKHNPRGDGSNGVRRFNRAGKFKKASNMNYAMWVSVSVEKRLANIYRGEDWNQLDENRVYADALQDVVEEQRGEIWADGNIRMGDYILLIDSDTRVPQDCFLEAVSEMEQSPRVAILQYSSGVMNVTDNFFERGITFFTNLVYTQIRYAVANGDVAPFVGHNAILRWTALQEIAYPDDEDEQDPNREKYWSEKTVSEDFDMALRLQTAGYIVRLGAYKGDGFKEGVSLTVYDELARWEKYAYGCNELIFFPLASWPKKGCFTPLFKSFIVSRMPLPSKVTIMAYIGTYYALGSAWFLTLLNYFVVGWYNGALDHYYVDSFKVYFAIIIVFTVLGNIALAILRYRISEQGLGYSFWENFKWVPLLVIFLGGISIHVSQALLCHMFGIDMSWGATAKEVENVSFFEEIPRVIKRFKFTFLFCFSCTVGMIVLAQFVPQMWRITFFTPIWPTASMVVCHFLLPIVLNPNLMLFTW
ncbi:hypothetical protein P154DRAFT_606305 [Amniculicola lignicola CBS 123094]|uniref:Uncharacterized protein n=1 Tax=Amniculicola lignicola CBS 123094 TaxID=1392246 RepID=A0A6A5WWJ9_9PLEO|nr:hypothetical protein P154DRAFT_606305 [Amniculicola lignicola CBS 123094]